MLREANKWLGASLWRPLPIYSPSSQGTDESTTVTPDDGIAITFHPDQGTLTRGKNVVSRSFPAPGSAMEQGGGCGEVRGIAQAFGGTAAGIVVLVPAVGLGGDSCFGLPAAETALAIPIQ